MPQSFTLQGQLGLVAAKFCICFCALDIETQPLLLSHGLNVGSEPSLLTAVSGPCVEVNEGSFRFNRAA